MDNLSKRRAIAIAGIAIATLGLLALIYGILNNNYLLQLAGFVSILAGYGASVIVNRLKKNA